MTLHNEDSSRRLLALNNVVASCDFDRTFPEQVFRGQWSDFLFFQSDYVFAPEFFDFTHELLKMEAASVACLMNLDRTEAYEMERAALLFIDELADKRAYMDTLRGAGPADGWIFAMDRFVCTSDIGKWCVYCEKANDVAVVGLRDISTGPALDAALNRVRAKPIEVLLKEGASPQFPFDRLVPVWRQGLTENYGHRKFD